MNNINKIILIGIFIAFVVSCNENKNEVKLPKYPIANKNSNDIKQTDIITKSKKINKEIDYIIFGRHCGECSHNCATMYKYDYIENKFLVDYSDSFFKNRDNITFANNILSKNKLDLVEHIKDSIPDILLSNSKIRDRFGCPDCYDGCGIYFEFKQNKIIRKYDIDYQTSQLNGEIKIFAEYLKRIIQKL